MYYSAINRLTTDKAKTSFYLITEHFGVSLIFVTRCWQSWREKNKRLLSHSTVNCNREWDFTIVSIVLIDNSFN